VIELRHLRYFVAVARREHFTQAAADLHVAQPALSAQIRQLESYLGVSLFERSNRRVRLTAAGTALLARAEAILTELERTESELREYAGVMRGTLTVGALPLLGELLFPRLIAEFNEAHPGVQIALHEEQNEHLIEMLRTGAIDLAVVDAAMVELPLPAGIVTEELFRSPAVVVVSKQHPLAARQSVELAELRNERFIAFTGGSSRRHQRFGALCLQAGFTLNPSFQVTQMGLMRSLAAHQLGISIAPRWLADTAGPAIATPELRDDGTGFIVALAWNEARQSPVTDAFLAFVQAAIKRDGALTSR
jgi:LysR family transcriptional activator of glutamate synthase operon